MGLPVVHDDCLITNGTSDSNVIDVAERVVVGILMPAAWTAANLSLRASVDGTNFFPVFDVAGAEVVITAAAATYISVPSNTTRPFRFFKVRSGTNAAPVAQAADRTLKLAIVNDIAS